MHVALSELHVGWRDLSTDMVTNRSCLCFACFRMSSGHPTIAMSLSVENDFTWQLTAQGHNVDLSTLPSLPTTLMSASEVDEVLKKIGSFKLCPANPDERFIPIAQSRNGKLNASGIYIYLS